MLENNAMYFYYVFCNNKSGINLNSNKLDKFDKSLVSCTYVTSIIMDNIHTLKTPIGKRVYSASSDPTQLVELIAQRYCTANKARFRVARVADICRCELRH